MAEELRTPPNEGDLFDYEKLTDYLGYLVGSVSRHRFFIVLVTAALVAATAVLLRGLPKTYRAETQILAVKSSILVKTVLPGTTDDWHEDPTRAAREAILSHDNLVALVQQTDLVKQYPRSRAPLLKLEDKILGSGRALSEADQLAAMVGTLERRLEVQVGAGTVSIALDWPEAAMAYELVNAAQHNFIEQRRALVVEPRLEGIELLERLAASAREEIVNGVERVEAAREVAGKRRPAAAPKRQLQSPERRREELRAALESKQRAIAGLVQSRQQQLAELQQRLADAQKIYAGGHTTVLQLQHELEELQAQGDTAELRDLKEEKEQLEGASRSAATRQLASATTDELESAPVEQAKEDLRFAMSKYTDLLSRLENARITLETAQANFKHRFSVVTPAELPRAPIKPKQPVILFGSVIGGLLLAVFLSALRDLRRGLVFERWQVLRNLGIPVLGEIHQ